MGGLVFDPFRGAGLKPQGNYRRAFLLITTGHRPIHNNYQTIIRYRVSKNKRKKTYNHFCRLVLENHFLVSWCITALFLADFVWNILDHFIFANCCTSSLFCKKLFHSTNFFSNCCTTGDHNFLMYRFFVFFLPLRLLITSPLSDQTF